MGLRNLILHSKEYTPYFVNPTSLLGKIITNNKDLYKHIEFTYSLKRNTLMQNLILLANKEQQKEIIENEYQSCLKDLMSSHYKYVASLLDTRLHLKNKNVIGYKRFLSIFIKPSLSKEIDYFLDECPESHHLRRFSDLSKRKSVEFWLIYDEKRKYAVYLLNLLKEYETPLMQDESLQNSQQLHCSKECIEDKEVIESLKKRIVELETTLPIVQDSEIRVYKDCKKVGWNGSKIDLIRLLIAANDSKLFKEDKGVPTQEYLMSYFSDVFDIDLTRYEDDLSKALKDSNTSNLKIFDKMKQAIQTRITKRL